MEVLSRLVTNIEQHGNNKDEIEILKFRCENCLAYQSQELLESFCEINNQIFINLSAMYQILCRKALNLNCCQELAVLNVRNEQQTVKGAGRPKLDIKKETLLNLKNLGFTWKEIASMLLVSRWTVGRRVKEFGIENITGYSDISDDELDRLIINIRNTHGSLVGRSLVTGCLQSQGIRVQRRRIMKSLIRIDPHSSRIRWACLIKRRKYNVPGPNSLWHADGHHSLINWGFVIHGAIDGYSRLIVYLKCATNNKADTVLECFHDAITTFGTPSRLRTDKGGENVKLWEEMEYSRGPNRGSFIAGSSVHNQRIERLWRDVWMYVANEYYYTFQAMEVEGLFLLTGYISFVRRGEIIPLIRGGVS